MNLQLGEDCGAIPHNEHSHNLGGCAPGLKCRKIHMGPKDTHGICVHQGIHHPYFVDCKDEKLLFLNSNSGHI